MKINQKQSKLKIIISNQQKVMYYIISFHLFSGNDVIKIVNDYIQTSFYVLKI